MKIILGHDYYDGAQSLGMDESVRFIRSPEIMNRHEFGQNALKQVIDQTPLKDLIQNSSLISVGLGVSLKSVKSWNSDNVCSELTLVGIAGKIYLGFAINADIHFRNVSGFYHIPNPVYCWSEEELNNFAERNKIQIAPRNVFKLGDFFKYNGTEFASIRDHMICKN